MPDIQFFALLPNPTPYGINKIRIRGDLKSSAEQFSINFVNDANCFNPQNITYHFKSVVRPHPQKLIENYKRDGEWMDHLERELEAFNGQSYEPSAYKNGDNLDDNEKEDDFVDCTTSLFPDSGFSLEFVLNYDDSTILVYKLVGDGSNYLTTYETTLNLSDIKAVQVWGEVERINEITFIYD